MVNQVTHNQTSKKSSLSFSILVSTLNYRIESNLKLIRDNPDLSFIVVNQLHEMSPRPSSLDSMLNVNLVNSNSCGLSKSRNIAIALCNSDICVIADDDIQYGPDLIETLRVAFADEVVDIVTFQDAYANRHRLKRYSKNSFKHGIFSALNVTSFEIAIRRSRIPEDIKFNELFGLGAKYPLGEENIFLCELIRSGLKAIYIPAPLVEHPGLSTGKHMSKPVEYAYARGAFWRCLFPRLYKLISFAYMFKNLFRIQRVIPVRLFYFALRRGAKDYGGEV